MDPDLQQLRPDASYTELLMRLVLSSWAARLWTYQEVAVGFHTFVVGDNCVFELDGQRMRFYKTKHVRQEPLSYVLEDALMSRLLRSTILLPAQFEKRPQMSYQRFFSALAGRSTSRQKDESVVIATFLRLDVDDLLAESEPDLRMMKLMQLLPFIPANVLFAWAPYGVAGLIVEDKVPSDLRRPEEVIERPALYIHPPPVLGLAAFFPSIQIQSAKDLIDASFTIVTQIGRFVIHDLDFGDMGRLPKNTFTNCDTTKVIIVSAFEFQKNRQDPSLLVEVIDERVGTDASHSERRFSLCKRHRVVTVTRTRENGYNAEHYPDAEAHVLKGKVRQPQWWLVEPAAQSG